MSQSRRHVECAESLPHATRVSTECRDISENMSRHAASPTSAHLTRHPMPKSPLHGHASHANSPLTRTRRTAPRWLEGLLSMPDRPVKKETGQNDSLRRENEKHEKGTTFAMRFVRSGAKSVLQITAGPSLVARDVEDLSWPPPGAQQGIRQGRRETAVFAPFLGKSGQTRCGTPGLCTKALNSVLKPGRTLQQPRMALTVALLHAASIVLTPFR